MSPGARSTLRAAGRKRGTAGNHTAMPNATSTAGASSTPNVVLQPQALPISVPMGTPISSATEKPATTSAIALPRWLVCTSVAAAAGPTPSTPPPAAAVTPRDATTPPNVGPPAESAAPPTTPARQATSMPRLLPPPPPAATSGVATANDIAYAVTRYPAVATLMR